MSFLSASSMMQVWSGTLRTSIVISSSPCDTRGSGLSVQGSGVEVSGVYSTTLSPKRNVMLLLQMELPQSECLEIPKSKVQGWSLGLKVLSGGGV